MARRSLLHAASLLLLEACNGGAHRGGRARGQGPAATSHGALAGLGIALPDATGDALHILLATEGAHVPGALLDLVTLHDLSKRGTIAGAVLACDSNLLRALGHGSLRKQASLHYRVAADAALEKRHGCRKIVDMTSMPINADAMCSRQRLLEPVWFCTCSSFAGETNS